MPVPSRAPSVGYVKAAPLSCSYLATRMSKVCNPCSCGAALIGYRMARDTFIWWGDIRPARAEIESALAKYVAGLGEIIHEPDQPGVVFVLLPGKPSYPFTHQDRDDERWFEVSFAADNIDVLTRQQDPITNAIATGFADMVALRWRGKKDDGTLG